MIDWVEEVEMSLIKTGTYTSPTHTIYLLLYKCIPDLITEVKWVEKVKM